MAENQNQNQNPQEDLNHLLKVRREKLAELQAAGRDPFQITKFDVPADSYTHLTQQTIWSVYISLVAV